MANPIFEAMTETQKIIIEKQSAGRNLSPDTFNKQMKRYLWFWRREKMGINKSFF